MTAGGPPGDDPSAIYSIECEHAVIACLLIEPQRVREVARRLKPEHFTLALARQAYVAMLEMSLAGETPEIIGVCRKLSLSNADKVRLSEMINGHHKSMHLESYAGTLCRLAWRRKLAARCSAVLEAVTSGADDAELSELNHKLAEARSDTTSLPLSAESLDLILARPMPATPWAVEGLLCLGDIAILAGAGGVGKSWISLYVALCLAAGEPLWGYLKVIQPYRVAVVDLESRPWEIDQRLCRLAAGLKVNPVIAAERVQVVRERLRLDRPEHVDRLIHSLREWGSQIVIIDSMRRTHGGDENSSTDTSNLFLDALDPIRGETGAAVILTDHVRKKTGEVELDSPEQALRGSTDKYNMSDLVVGAERRDGRIAIHPSKGRHRGAPLEPFLVEFSGFGPEDAHDAPVESCYVGPLDVPARENHAIGLIVRQLREAQAAGCPRPALVAVLDAAGYKAASRTASRCLAALVEEGTAKRSNNTRPMMYWHVDHAPSDLVEGQ